MNPEDVRELVRNRYGAIAQGDGSVCCTRMPKTSCCGGGAEPDIDDLARRMGYSAEDLAVVGDGANLGLGCGNPQAIADMRPGEVVVDLGSGAGFDCFLAARQIGPAGHVIGIDMTPEMPSCACRTPSSGWAKSSTCPSPTSSSPTASSTCRRTSPRCCARRSAR